MSGVNGVHGVNGVRGEVRATLGGAERRLCLTLGALAEIETGLGVAGVEALAARLRALSAADGLARAPVTPAEAAAAVARAFAAAAA